MSAAATRYVVSRLFEGDVATSKVMLNATTTEQAGRRYGRAIQKLTYGPQCWKYAGQIVSQQNDLDRITATHGVDEDALLRRTGIDLRGFAA